MRATLVLISVLIFGTGHAAAMDAADWATFEQETYGQYWQKNSPPELPW